MGLPAFSLGQEFFDGGLEARQLLVHRLPDDVEIGDEVLVCEDWTSRVRRSESSVWRDAPAR
jgi:hypothetical protein